MILKLLPYLKLGPLKTTIFILKHHIYKAIYTLFHDVKGKTLKGSCGFYLKPEIKFKPKKELDNELL